MLDELVGGIFVFIGRILLYVLFEIFFQIICFYLGYSLLMVLTFGQYGKIKNIKGDGTFESIIGGVTLLVGLFFVFK